MATSFTLAQLIALEEAYAQGVQSVEFEGKKVVYRSSNDMLRAIIILRRALSDTTDDGTRIASLDSGLD